MQAIYKVFKTNTCKKKKTTTMPLINLRVKGIQNTTQQS